MWEYVIYHRGSFYKFGTSEEFVSSDSTCIALVSRKLLFADRVSISKVALKEGGKEVLLYQARKLFGIEDPLIAYEILREDEKEVELLLFALEREEFESVVRKANEKGIDLYGISLLSKVLALSIEGEGSVWIRWDDGYEVGICSDGKLEDVFFLHLEDEEGINLLKKNYATIIEIDPFTCSIDLPIVKSVLFRNPARRKAPSTVYKVCVAVLLILILAMGYGLFDLRGRLSHFEKEKKVLIERYKKLGKKKEEIVSLKKQIKEYEEIFRGVKPVEIIALLAKNVPPNTEFWSFYIERKKIEIEGFTPSMSAFLESMGKIPGVVDLKLLYSRTTKGFSGLKGEMFRIRLRVRNEKTS